MIILETLRWSYCFSYGPDNVIHLNKNILTQIIGTNGKGKSSIPLILEEVLYNKNSKGTKKASIPNRYENKGYWINLVFTRDEDQYEIDVNRRNSIKVKLFRNGEDISSHTATGTYKTIQGIMGMDFKTFSQIVYQNTNASLQFLTATDTNRKKFLIDLLHLEEYVKIFEVFKLAAKNLVSETVGYTAQIATIEKWLADNKLTDTNILPMLNLEIDTEEDEKGVERLTTQIANISQKNKKISQNNQFKQLLEKVNLQEAEAIKVTSHESYDKLQGELGLHQNNVIIHRQIIEKIRKLGRKCHVCEQSISEEFKIELKEISKARKIEAEQSVIKIKEKISEIKQRNTDFARKVRIEKDWGDLYRSIDLDLSSQLLDGVELGRSLLCVKAKLQSAKKKLSDLARENQRRVKQNTRIQVILEQTDSFIEQLKEAEESLSNQAMLLSNLEVLKKAFSTNGLLAYKIENMVKDLEGLVNTYLADLSDGKFTLEFVINNDKLDVQITDDGNIVDILELSTGELARVNTATLLAIRRLMSSISKSKINVLFLDEVISVLDDEGKERIVEILLEEKGLNTYAVAHAWTHPLLEKIIVHKENKMSYLET